MRTPSPRGFPDTSPMARACDHMQARSGRAATDAPPLDAPPINRRYLAALARSRAALARPIAPSATVTTVKVWHDEKRIKFDVGKGADKRTVRAKIQLALVRVRYGSKRRAWFILRTSSHGATVLDSRDDSRRSFAWIHADMARMGLDADAINAHLRSVLVERATRAPQVAPELPCEVAAPARKFRAQFRAGDLLRDTTWRVRFGAPRKSNKSRLAAIES